MSKGKKVIAPIAPIVSVSVQYACKDDALPSRYKIKRWATKSVLEGNAEVTVRLVDAEEGLALNSDFRGRGYATNVLSFPYVPVPDMAGDLVLCVPVVLREAKEQKKTVEAHFAHLIVHGMLHLQGFNHETSDEDADMMEAEERTILAQLGFADPYAGER